MKPSIAGAVALLTAVSATAASAAEACGEGLKTEGSLLTGKTFKNSSVLPGVAVRDAYARALAFTMDNGFTIISANAELGQITAAQSAQAVKGSNVPLTIVVREAPQGAQLSINYRTGIGQMSPEAAVAAHFCKTFAAAADANAPKAPVVAQAAAPSAPAAPPAAPAALVAPAAPAEPTAPAPQPAATSFIRDGFPCIQDVCVGQDITKVKGIQWLDANPRLSPQKLIPPTPDQIARVGTVVKTDPETLKILASADVQRVYGARALAALSRIEASCATMPYAGPFGLLDAYFKSPAGHVTLVNFGPYSPPGDPKSQYYRIRNIYRFYATAITHEQRSELGRELEKQYEPVIRAHTFAYSRAGQFPSVHFQSGTPLVVELHDRADLWMDANNRLLLHPKCGGTAKIDVN